MKDRETHTVTIADIEKALPKFMDTVLKGKIKLTGMTTIQDLLDAGQYDAISGDAVVQIAVFGEVIYG
jgi:hypothetical protein